MSDSWTVAVRYDLKDLYAISWQSWRLYLKLLGWLVGAFLILEVGLPLFDGARLTDALAEIDYYTLVPMALIIVVIVALVPIVQLRARKKQGWDVPMLVKLDDEGVSVDHPMGNQRTFWKALPKVRATQDRLFLFTAPSCAYILPKRCFANQAEFQRWIEFSERCWSAAKVAE